jgi:transcriptional regulator with XRE-family HTH domain
MDGTASSHVVEIDEPYMGLRAVNQLRENIKALLLVRKEEQKSLALAASIDPSTLSKFLKGEREIQLANLDAVADFFGIATYQLFQPGISVLTERRVSERRAGRDRRIGHAQRQLGALRAALEPARPKRGRDVGTDPAAIQALVVEFQRRFTALLAQADARRQATAPRETLTKPRPRTGTTGGSDPPGD